MFQDKPIPIVDLFAGPGGLGEGFTSIDEGRAFNIIVSAEMEKSAHQTLQLRSYYRILRKQGGKALDSYYQMCNGETKILWNRKDINAWAEARNEARQITLGTKADNRVLNKILNKAKLGPSKPWVLIGGPPCQAYSLAGRSRNRGKVDYCAEDDNRHYLYREYLKIIQKYQPAVFVMENVKGILSSKVGGQRIFHTILRDLSNPDFAVGKKSGRGYKIHSLVTSTVYKKGMDPDDIDVHDYIIRSENFGIPQARHRVILLGIREDIRTKPGTLKTILGTKVSDVISDLPCLRSRISKQKDSPEKWARVVKRHLHKLLQEASRRDDLTVLAKKLKAVEHRIKGNIGHGSLRQIMKSITRSAKPLLDSWYHDKKLKVWLNHEARSHMTTDLRRYLYAASYAGAYGHSPKGHKSFNLAGLSPNHKNWKTGNFSDRFRVQLYNHPATTVTSHISKDGHYFIHPDPAQCRSLTVREAARLQTFPDNYFFMGNRTQQFHQVGNAVPPLLAYQIAAVVKDIVR